MMLNLPIEELKTLRRLQHSKEFEPYWAQITCILMLAHGQDAKTVAYDLGISLSSVYNYVDSYKSGGISKLTDNHYKGYWGLLDSSQIAALCAELRRKVYTDAKSVAQWIKCTFGVSYTPQGTVDLLNRIGFTYKKTTEVPCEADARKQEEFVEELSKTLRDMDSSAVVYYADDVHPMHNSRSTYAWVEKGERMEQPTVSGRDRINLNGLLNAHDVTDVIALDCPRVNAQSTRELYEAALARHPEASEIYIISDNAKYYHNKELAQWVKGTRIRQVFLPPYSPNLNLIERLWKMLRKKVINTGFYRTKEEFRRAVTNFFEHIADYKEEFESLLTLNFRLVNSKTISL